MFFFYFQNIQGVYFSIKNIREKKLLRKDLPAVQKYICLMEKRCVARSKLMPAAQERYFFCGRACPVNLRNIYFSCCAGRTRGSISVAQTCGPHHQQISEIFLLCQQSSRHYVTRKMCGTTPPTNIATDVFEECATCLL